MLAIQKAAPSFRVVRPQDSPAPSLGSPEAATAATSGDFTASKRHLRLLLAPLLGLALVLSGCQQPGPRALLKGERYLQEKNYAKALEQLQVAVKLLPNHAQAWNHLGLAYHGLKQSQNAQKAYHNALILDRKLASARFNLGCLLLEEGQFEGAVNELTSYTMLEPAAEAGWLQLGRAQLQGGRLTDADTSFRRLLQLVPDHPEALNNLGVVQMKRGRSAEAMQFFNRATAVHPDYGPAILNEAVIQHHYLKNKVLALKRYQDYLALEPRPEDWAAVSETVQELDRTLHPVPQQPVEVAVIPSPAPNPAPATAPPGTDTLPPSTRLASNAGQPAVPAPTPSEPDRTSAPAAAGLTNLARSATASTTPTNLPTTARPRPAAPIATASATPPSRPSAAPAAETNKVARATSTTAAATRPAATATTTSTPADATTSAQGATQMAHANTAAQRALASIPRYQYGNPAPGPAGDRIRADLTFREGIKWYRAGRQALAVERYKEATRLDPSYYEAWINLGVAAFEGADWRTSLSAYEMARAIKPDSSLAQYNFCLALQKANYPLDALQELRRFLQDHPDEARGHLALANLYDQVFRNPKLARPHYQKVLELDGRHPEAQNIRYWLNHHRASAAP